MKIIFLYAAAVVLGVIAGAALVQDAIYIGIFSAVAGLLIMKRINELENEIRTKPTVIVCAANRHRESGIVLCGVRHFDDLMRNAVRAMNNGEWDKSWNSSEQGFVDNYGNFHTREQACKIARRRLQIKYTGLGYNGKKTLFSENLH